MTSSDPVSPLNSLAATLPSTPRESARPTLVRPLVSLDSRVVARRWRNSQSKASSDSLSQLFV